MNCIISETNLKQIYNKSFSLPRFNPNRLALIGLADVASPKLLDVHDVDGEKQIDKVRGSKSYINLKQIVA